MRIPAEIVVGGGGGAPSENAPDFMTDHGTSGVESKRFGRGPLAEPIEIVVETLDTAPIREVTAIGTLDGANIEILEEVGGENFFLFGLTAEQVIATQADYEPNALIESDADLRQVMRLLEAGRFHADQDLVPNALLQGIRSPTDPWMVAADFGAFVDLGRRIDSAHPEEHLYRQALLAGMGISGAAAVAERNVRRFIVSD